MDLGEKVAKDSPSPGQIPKKILRKIITEYVALETPNKDICTKYHISKHVLDEIVKRLELLRKRDEYRRTVVQKALDRLSDRQSRIIVDSVELMFNHLQSAKRSQIYGTLDSETINDVMKIHALITKTKALAEGKATENMAITVQVELPHNMPVISDKVSFPSMKEVVSEVAVKEELVVEKPSQPDGVVVESDEIPGIL